MGRKMMVYPPEMKFKQGPADVVGGYVLIDELNFQKFTITKDNRIRAEINQAKVTLQLKL